MADPAPQPPLEASAAHRKYVVCREDELQPGDVVIAPIGKFGVGVYNVGGDLYALTNYCPHMGGPLCVGNVHGTNVWNRDDGRVDHVLDGQVVRCPWHSWEFDVSTGRAIGDPAKHIRTYEVRVEDGHVVVTR